MGGGNQQKSAMARAKKLAEGDGPKAKSTLKDTNKAAVKCAVCMQCFSITVREGELKQHIEAKHSGKMAKTMADCFPGWTE
jgi:nitrous oxide reductase accessory protein NosL